MSAARQARPNWPRDRMAGVLDRIEHRQEGIGLKFWGPPLWLEVTMTGPDSDRWPANAVGDEAWNWQSTETCDQAELLLAQGADDNELVTAVGRYTLENLILNAVHEIGEWFRFDGQRVFPAHMSPDSTPDHGDEQGNGSVNLDVSFAPMEPTHASPADEPFDQLRAQRRLRRVIEVARPSRFTYLPATSIHFDASRLGIRRHPDQSSTQWRSKWSPAAIEAAIADTDPQTLLAAVQRDVHGALVRWEADRICRALHIDQRRRWRLAGTEAPPGAEPADGDTEVDEIVSLAIVYSDLRPDITGEKPDPRTPRQHPAVAARNWGP